MRATRTRKSAATSEKIIRAAMTIAEQKGFAAINFARIGAMLGLTRSAIYQYAPDVETIIKAVVVHANDTFNAIIEDRTRGTETPAELLQAYIEACFDERIFNSKYKAIYLNFWAYLVYHPDLRVMSVIEYEQNCQRLEAVFARLGVQDPVRATKRFWIFIDGVWLWAAQAKGGIDRRAAIDLAMEMSAEVFVGPSAANVNLP